jgi:hypothetical protein
MKTVFLCGPISGIAHNNIPAFIDARSKVYIHNMACFAAPLMLKKIDLSNSPVDFMKETIQLMVSSHLVVTMDNWHECEFAVKQVEIARRIGLEVQHISVFPKGEQSKAVTTIINHESKSISIASETVINEERMLP